MVAIQRGDAETAVNKFMGIADEGLKSLTALRTVTRVWGRERVRHYQWALKGESYSNKLRTAALRVYEWSEAVLKLHRLMLRRHRQIGRRDINQTINPIEPDDLENLAHWTGKDEFVKRNDNERLQCTKLLETDLPSDHGFDSFGLMIRMKPRNTATIASHRVHPAVSAIHTNQGKIVQTLRPRRPQARQDATTHSSNVLG